MPVAVSIRPRQTDFAEYYAKYINLVPAGDLVSILEKQAHELNTLLRPLSHEEAAFTYAEGKWTIREVVGHLTDAERVFAYRATAFSRGDANPLPSFDQDVWTPAGRYNDRPMDDVLEEWLTARRSTIALLRAMPEDGLNRRGTASGNPVSALACVTTIAGHVAYHRAHLEEHYLAKLRA